MSRAGEHRAIAYSAAGIYAGAMVMGMVETAIPGGPEFSVVPGIVALVLTPLVALFGPRLSRAALFLLGPFGAALIAFALASTHGSSDAAVMYMWPVLWTASFYDGERRSASSRVSPWRTRSPSRRCRPAWATSTAGSTSLCPSRSSARWCAGSRRATSGSCRTSRPRRASIRSRACSTAAGSRSASPWRSPARPATARAWRAFAERVRAAVAATALGVTVSAGVGAGESPLDPRALLSAADAALYAAKRGGRDRTVVAPDALAA